jgi:hypothetical protein
MLGAPLQGGDGRFERGDVLSSFLSALLQLLLHQIAQQFKAEVHVLVPGHATAAIKNPETFRDGAFDKPATLLGSLCTVFRHGINGSIDVTLYGFFFIQPCRSLFCFCRFFLFCCLRFHRSKLNLYAGSTRKAL